MKKITKEELKALGRRVLPHLSVVSFDSGRVYLKETYNEDAGWPIQKETYKENWNISRIMLRTVKSERDFWDTFTTISGTVAGGIQLTDGLSFDEVMDNLPDNIYVMSAREISKFADTSISGEYTICFQRTYYNRIEDVVKTVEQENPVKLKAVNKITIFDVSHNFGERENLRICVTIARDEETLSADFMTYNNECQKVILMSLRAEKPEKETYQILGEISCEMLCRLQS